MTVSKIATGAADTKRARRTASEEERKPDTVPSEEQQPEVEPELSVKGLLVDLDEALKNKDDVDLGELAKKMYDLGGLLHGPEDRRKEAYELKGHFTVVSVMRKWRDHEEIQGNCCLCIMNMTCDIEESKKAFLFMGAMGLVVDAMKRFPNADGLQRLACGALGNFLDQEGEEDHKSAAIFFVSGLNGTSWIVKAMKKFPENEDIQEDACLVIRNLSYCEDVKPSLLAARALSAATAALELFPNNAEIANHFSVLNTKMQKK